MSHITNHLAVSQELNLAYDKAIQRLPAQADEIDDVDDVFEAANELHMSIRVIDQCIDTMDSKWAVDTGSKFMWLANKLFSRSTHGKVLFTWRDTPVSWRGSPVENIVYAIEIEADWYKFFFNSFLDGKLSDDDVLLSLRTQIRWRTAKDDNAENAGSSSSWTPDAESETEAYLNFVADLIEVTSPTKKPSKKPSKLNEQRLLFYDAMTAETPGITIREVTSFWNKKHNQQVDDSAFSNSLNRAKKARNAANE